MNVTHTIIGMPGAGKTTYLAALWHLITSAELDTALRFDRLEGDTQYLNSIVESWQKCEKVQRTSSAEDHPIVIHLKEHVSSAPVTLNFTDLSGENFRQQFVSRTCMRAYRDEVNGNGELMLFINADRPHQGVTILDANGLIGGESAFAEVEWEPKFAPEQAQLVDLLQCLQQDPFVPKLRRLAIIISAWDVVTHCQKADEWVCKEMPFLHQFLSNNKQSFQTCMYGVSAQGGALKTDAEGHIMNTDERNELLSKIPSEKVRCVGPTFDSSDITLPLQWLSGLNDG